MLVVLQWLGIAYRFHLLLLTLTLTCLTALFPRTTQVSRYRKVKPIRISLKQETVSAVVSAGPYASLHLAPDR